MLWTLHFIRDSSSHFFTNSSEHNSIDPTYLTGIQHVLNSYGIAGIRKSNGIILMTGNLLAVLVLENALLTDDNGKEFCVVDVESATSVDDNGGEGGDDVVIVAVEIIPGGDDDEVADVVTIENDFVRELVVVAAAETMVVVTALLLFGVVVVVVVVPLFDEVDDDFDFLGEFWNEVYKVGINLRVSSTFPSTPLFNRLRSRWILGWYFEVFQMYDYL